MALGGVATGSMKAKEELRVQGIITYRGFTFMDLHWETHGQQNYLASKGKEPDKLHYMYKSHGPSV